MTTRVSKQYKPIELKNCSNNRDYSNNNISAPTLNNQQGNSTGLIAGQVLAQIFGAFANAGSNSSPAPNDKPAVKPKNTPQKEVQTKEEVKPEEKIKKALSDAGIDYESKSKEFKSHILQKYNTMMRVYGDNKPDDSIINQRLVNYAKGYEFHHFELLASQGADVEGYKLDTSNTEDNTQKYKDFGAQYVELYDKNGDGKADIWEIFHEELIEQYMIVDKMDSKTAQAKAIDTVAKYSKMSFEEINSSTDNSTEMQLLKAVMVKTGSISQTLDPNATLENLQDITPEEAARLALTYASYGTPDAEITATEYRTTEIGLAQNHSLFTSYMKHADDLLK